MARRGMTVVYYGEEPPEKFSKSIFLAGPSTRKPEVRSWRPRALRLLRKLKYDGVVFVPEWRNHREFKFEDYDPVVNFEHRGMEMSDVIVAWVPRSLPDMPGFTTNVEFGWKIEGGKLVLGAPKKAEKMTYLKKLHEKVNGTIYGGGECWKTLEQTLRAALVVIGDGAERQGGERFVPLIVWRQNSFQSWLIAQKAAGNRLDGAKVEWLYRAKGDRPRVVYWAVKANVYVAAENRNKTNEVVIGRPDVSVTVLYDKRAEIGKTRIVLTKEFRSAVRNSDCFVRDLPGGSNDDPNEEPLRVACDEIMEETGLFIWVTRLRSHGFYQISASTLSHGVNLFSAELRDEEIASVEKNAGKVYGVDPENPTGEKVYVELPTFDEIMSGNLVDTSTKGMIAQVLYDVYKK